MSNRQKYFVSEWLHVTIPIEPKVRHDFMVQMLNIFFAGYVPKKKDLYVGSLSRKDLIIFLALLGHSNSEFLPFFTVKAKDENQFCVDLLNMARNMVKELGIPEHNIHAALANIDTHQNIRCADKFQIFFDHPEIGKITFYPAD